MSVLYGKPLRRLLPALAAIVATATAAPGLQARASGPPQAAEIKVDDIIERMNNAERGVIVRMRMYQPLMEVYIQDVTLDEHLGWVPTADDYFLGQFHLGEAPALLPLSQVKRPRGAPYSPDGFAAMALADWHVLERTRYEFKYVKREFLGDARCFVFDVKPLREGREGFLGRIWVDDRDYNVVRFNGINRSTDQLLSRFFRRTLSFHVDSWRTNVLPGVWLPSYVYSEETDLSGARSAAVRFKSQTRIWGYRAQTTDKAEPLTTIRADEAESNVIERLEAAGLLSPPGDVDRLLETVLNNLVISNNLALERPLRCRILLTSPLESFTVGRTIVLSRGLIDVLPDESSLAMMLAHELSHVALGHPLIDTKFSFADRLMVADAALLATLQFRHGAREETAADEKVIELLRNSPYKDTLADAGLFIQTVHQRARQLPRLIQSHIGDHIVENGQAIRLAEVAQQAPALAPDSLDQIPALPLGARLVVDAWNGRLTLDRTPAVPLTSIREKVPLAVTPLIPLIKYAQPVE